MAYDHYLKNKNSPSPAPGQEANSLPNINRPVEDGDELAIFGGRTRLFSPRRGGSSTTTASASPMEGTRRTPPSFSNPSPHMEASTSSNASDAGSGLDAVAGFSSSGTSSRSSQDLSTPIDYPSYGTNATAGTSSSNGRSQMHLESGYRPFVDGGNVKYEWNNTAGYARGNNYPEKVGVQRVNHQLGVTPPPSTSQHQYYSPDALSPQIPGRSYDTLPFSIPSMQAPNNNNSGPHIDGAPYLYQHPSPPNGQHMYSYPLVPQGINIGPSGPVHIEWHRGARPIQWTPLIRARSSGIRRDGAGIAVVRLESTLDELHA